MSSGGKGLRSRGSAGSTQSRGAVGVASEHSKGTTASAMAAHTAQVNTPGRSGHLPTTRHFTYTVMFHSHHNAKRKVLPLLLYKAAENKVPYMRVLQKLRENENEKMFTLRQNII